MTETINHQAREAAARWAERLDDDLTAAEREEFQRWLMTDELHQRELRAHTAILNLSRDLPDETREDLLALALRDTPRRSPRRTVWVSALAASVLLTLGLTGWLVHRHQVASTAHITTAGMTRDITLPDGSVAHLNARTDLRWIARADERRVALLEGEALFEVQHDPAKPFAVVLDTSEIRVLGTRFNVRRRPSAEVVLTVLEGSVAVSQLRNPGSTRPAWTRELHANEQIVYSTAGLVRDVHPVTGANAARWREGILEFDDESLSNIVADLSRYTDRHIVVRDPRLAQLRLGGQLNVHNSIESSLGLLEKLAPIAARRSGDTFVLDYRQSSTEERH